MANDHYVAQTYLRHFAGESGKLQAFRKSDAKSFPCSPKDICAELDGDIIPDFLTNPKYLGEYRATFERQWNPAVKALQAKSLTKNDKLHIAGYWANLMVCTPTWKRVGIDVYNKMVENHLRALNQMAIEKGKPDKKLAEGIKMLDRGEIAVGTEGDFIRAQSASTALHYAWKLYNADWMVFENDTDTKFFTSDNPATFEDYDTWGKRDFARILPITPELCLMCDLTKQPELRDTQPDFTKEPKGTVRSCPAKIETIKRINICTAKSAENLILSNADDKYAKLLAATYSKFHVENESSMTKQGNGYLIGNRSRVIRRES